MEPRNIGVILWCKGQVRAKFLEPGAAAAFVNEIPTYNRWVEYWTKCVAGDSIEPRRGKSVSKSTADCLDALLSTQKGNYILEDVGELLEVPRKREIQDATDFLFRELVAMKPPRVPLEDRRGLSTLCNHILDRSGISEREDFRKRYPIKCQVFGAPRHLHFSYGCGNGRPELLMQKVLLKSEQSVSTAALMLHSIISDAILPRQRCLALFRLSDRTSRMEVESLDSLKGLCNVLDVEDDSTVDRLAEFANE